MRWVLGLLPPLARRTSLRSRERAKRALDAGRYEEAAEAFEEALWAGRRGFGVRHPELLLPLTGAGVALVRSQRFEEAERYFTEALEHCDAGFADETGWRNVYGDSARLMWSLGKLRTSLALYEKLEERFGEGPERHSIRIQRAIGCRWLFRMEEARAHAASLPDDAHWPTTRSFLLGRIDHLEGDRVGAVGHYRRVLATLAAGTGYREVDGAPGSGLTRALASSRLAVVLFELGERDEARALGERAQTALAALEEGTRERGLEVLLFDRAELAEDPRESLERHREARAFRRKRLGPSAPRTLESRVRCLERANEAGLEGDEEVGALRARIARTMGQAHPWAQRLSAIESGS